MASWRSQLLVAIAAFTPACSGSLATRATQRGDLAALRDAIAAAERAGSFSDSDAATLARVVAERELRTASGAAASDRVRDVRPCARELDDALASRMLVHDAAGAQAALARIDGGGALRHDAARVFSDDADSDWRAVAARLLVGPADHDARMRALIDAAPQVRRQAARAAGDARNPAELDALGEAARLDPTPWVRTDAVRAIAAFPTSDIRTVGALRDLWRSGDEGLREDIAFAWSSQALWPVGGRDELHLVVASEHGPAAIAAAAAVLRRRDADAEVTLAAVAHFERAIESGPSATRVQALAQAPLDRRGLLAAVENARGSEDLRVRVVALARLVEAKQGKAEVPAKELEELEELARAGSPVAGRARLALALAGDRRIQAWIEQDLGADQPEARLAAVTELVAMGRAARAAPLLADVNAAVRLRAACKLILASRR